MNNLGLRHNVKYRKSATVVGEVLGKYHPHGDVAVYDSMVRMAQDFSLRYPMVDGQGNFGSMDGDGAAAMRYTEARMTRYAEEMLADIDKDTVDFMPNYDGSQKEPKVLPAKVPNLLLNGVQGIAVGMATNIPTHNLSEVVDAILHLIEHPDSTMAELMEYVKGRTSLLVVLFLMMVVLLKPMVRARVVLRCELWLRSKKPKRVAHE